MKRKANATIVFFLFAAFRLPRFARAQGKPLYPADLRFEFARISPGEVEMGCSPGDSHCSSDEKPQHHVRISKGFEIGKYLVTQAMWEGVMGTNPSYFKGADRPVEKVSWNDVQEFLQRLNARNDGHRYRLPTEAEWEYAARRWFCLRLLR